MTLVLPFGLEQIASNSLYNQTASSSMPCVFDNDAFERDFESALIRDWTSDISDYDIPAEDSTIKTPSGMKCLKRKPSEDTEETSFVKKSRFESSSPEALVSSDNPEPFCRELPTPPSSSPSFLDENASSPSSSSSSSSPEDEEEGSGSPQEDEEDYIPRRRGIQMWNSRQRWKDERKRVMKMSVTKLSEIEDPELCLLRSVLINNTIKRLHSDIRSDRRAKLMHRHQRLDQLLESMSKKPSGDCQPDPKPDSRGSDFYDESSCDEIFGLNEDFMRVVPDRRVSSPVPQSRTPDPQPAPESMDVDPSPPCPVTTATVTCSIPPFYGNNSSCDTNGADCGPSYYGRRQQPCNNSTQNRPPSLKQIIASVSSGGGQCATQYRTNRDCSGENSFPPRVPILDEVVYHSLLASLES